MKNTNKKSIIIDMVSDDPSDVKALLPENLIHHQQFGACKELIEKQKKSASTYKPEIEYLHYHNTISIIGSRGVGKTTFLLSIKKYYEENEPNDYALIDIIDPTVIEKKQHPFINILTLLHKYVIERIDKWSSYQIKKSYNPNIEFDINFNDYKSGCDKFEYYYKKWEKYYSNILKSLPYMDGIGKASAYADWDDSEYITERGIKIVEYFNQLEQDFHHFINCSLKLLNKQCFILFFDDIDTNFIKGYEVLETIRKYLSTPQIVVLLTGDLELYSNLIRQAQWESFSEKYLEVERIYSKKANEQFPAMINHLENQYLLKLFKPEYRLVLNSIGEKLELEKEVDIYVKYFRNQEPENIKQIYRKFTEIAGFNIKNTQINSVILNRLLTLSIRTQLRILAFLKKQGEKEIDDIEVIISLFWSDLNQLGIEYKNLSNNKSSSTITLLKFLRKNDLLNSNFNFLPNSNNEITDKAILAITALCNHSFKKNPGLIIDYWLRIQTLQFFLTRVDELEQDKLLKQCKVFSSDIDLADMITNLEIYLDQKDESNEEINEKNSETSIPGHLNIDYKEKLTISNLDQLLFPLPLYNVDIKNQESCTHYSFFRLLGIISELLKIIYHSNFNDETENENECIPKIALYLRKHSSIQNYFSDIRNNVIKKSFKHKRKVQQPFYALDNEQLEKFSKDIFFWAKNFEKLHIKIDLYCVDAIFTKFLSHISSINEDEQSYSIGHYFNRVLINFYNSCIVEECLNNNINEVNITKSFFENESDILGNNYQLFKQRLPSIENTFFEWLYKCPILNSFTSEMTRYIFILPLTNKSIYKNIWDKHREEFFKKNIENIDIQLKEIDEELLQRDKYENKARESEIDELKYQSYKRIFDELSRTKGNSSLLTTLHLLPGKSIGEKMDNIQQEITQLSKKMINNDKFLYEEDYGNYQERTNARKSLIRKRKLLIEKRNQICKFLPTLLSNMEQIQQKAILGDLPSDNELTIKLNQYFMYRDVSDLI